MADAASPGRPVAVQVDRVSLSYPAPARGAAPLQALQDVSLTAAAGEVLALVGPSGCGKTTLLELICGLTRADTGAVTALPAALMAQRDLLLPWASALDNATLALRVGPRPVLRDRAREQALSWFGRVGLAGFEHVRPDQLSGGMRQRVAFLRTLLSGKPVLCLDEPFASLDAITRSEMQAWLAQVLHDDAAAGDARTVVLVTHDVEEAVLLADRVLVMSPRPGRIVEAITVTPARPRVATDPQIVGLRARALQALGGA